MQFSLSGRLRFFLRSETFVQVFIFRGIQSFRMTRVRAITRTASTQRLEGDGFDARPKDVNVVPIAAMSDGRH